MIKKERALSARTQRRDVDGGMSAAAKGGMMMKAEFPLAVHALVYLLHTQRFTTSAELAGNICTNSARVRKVLSKLHRAGLVEAERGKGSGYRCLPMTGVVTLKQVMQALAEEPISMNWRSGDMNKECLISSGMGRIMDQLYHTLNLKCMDWLEGETIANISDRIFGTKE